MNDSRAGIGVVIGLAVAAPVLTLVATAYQMWGTGEGIRPTAVTVQAPEPAAAPAAGAGNASAPAPGAPGPAAPGNAPAAGAGGAASTPAVAPAPAKPPEPVPGRSAQDFSAQRPAWEASLQHASAEQGQKLAQAGKPASGVQACVACHGQQGVAQPGGMFPSLAGLSAEYIAKQLTDYRNGARNQALMTTIAKGLGAEEIGHLAAYYASLPPPPLTARPTGPEAARKLDVEGDNARALPACANCHGLGGRGEGALLPRLAGQPPGYFIGQMNAFRTGQRHNDDVGVMRAFAQRLTPQEIEGLASYYAESGQAPARGAGEEPAQGAGQAEDATQDGKPDTGRGAGSAQGSKGSQGSQGSDQRAGQGSGQDADQGSGQGSDQGSGQGSGAGSGQGASQGSDQRPGQTTGQRSTENPPATRQ